MILLDTNVVSELMRRSPDPAVEAWVLGHAVEALFFSAVGEAELRYGAAILPAGRDRGLGDELVESGVRACHHRCKTPLHLLRRNLVEKMADIPAMARRVTQPARPLAVELVLRFGLDLGARLGRATNHGVGIVDLQVHRDRGAAQRQRSQDAVFRELFSQHERRTAEIEHSVPNAPVGICQSKISQSPRKPRYRTRSPWRHH